MEQHARSRAIVVVLLLLGSTTIACGADEDPRRVPGSGKQAPFASIMSGQHPPRSPIARAGVSVTFAPRSVDWLVTVRVVPFAVLTTGDTLTAARPVTLFDSAPRSQLATGEAPTLPGADRFAREAHLRRIIAAVHEHSSLLLWAPLLEAARKQGLMVTPAELESVRFEIVVSASAE